MTQRIFVRPGSPGLSVPDPMMGDLFPEGGRETVKTVYVQRRLAAGELVEAEAPKQSEAADTPPETPADPEGDDPPVDPEESGEPARAVRRRR